MAKFVTGNDLNAELSKIFKEAESELYLISPYIKLHNRIKDELKDKMDMPGLAVTVVFGKNENDLRKSLSLDDLEFFMQLPNITVCYEPRLHAKYYANEHTGLITSMNLYDFSQDNNIESGVMTKASLMGGGLDTDALDYFVKVAERSEVIYKKEPVYEKIMLGMSKKYSGSEVRIDNLETYFGTPTTREYKILTRVKVTAQKISYTTSSGGGFKGYCIRTGVAIPFNVERPFSPEAYKRWAKYADVNYAEKYCHFSGEPSEGATSYSKPILNKNWKAAKSIHNL